MSEQVETLVMVVLGVVLRGAASFLITAIIAAVVGAILETFHRGAGDALFDFENLVVFGAWLLVTLVFLYLSFEIVPLSTSS